MESPAKAADAAVAVQNLIFTYPEREQPALRDVTLTVKAGEFVVLCGPSGCGKTTLLRQLKPTLAPHGRLSGEILFEGTPLTELSQRDAASRIGFVLQSPENQIVTDKVWHELAFGLESLGFDTPAIRLPGGGDGQLFRDSNLVLQKCHRAFRRPEAIAGTGFGDGAPALPADSGRAHQPT